MHVLHIKDTDPYSNLALEEHLLRTRNDDDILLLWQNTKTIVVGCHQNTLEEINSAFVQEQGIHVVRRISGGGAVYHDLGNVNFSFITTAERAATITMERFTNPIVQALRNIGIPANISGRNDISAHGYKISGNAQHLYKNRLLHHGTLLFSSTIDTAAQALTVNPIKLHSKSIKSVRSRITNIQDLLTDKMSIDAFIKHIVDFLTHGVSCTPLSLQADDYHSIATLRNSKYTSWEWIYGKSPPFTMRNFKKFAGGSIEACLNVEAGIITQCFFYGDFMALKPIAHLTEKLCGCRYTTHDVAAIVRTVPLHEYIGSITLEELLQCIFAAGKGDTQT